MRSRFARPNSGNWSRNCRRSNLFCTHWKLNLLRHHGVPSRIFGQLRQAESFYRSGYKADVTAVRPQLQAAQQALNSQEYERAIQLANTVVSVSRQELRRAQSAADATEQRHELERRDRSRSLGAGLGVMSTGISNGPAAVHSSGVSLPDNIQTISASSPPSSSSHSQSSSSGWSSETSQSSW